MPARSRIYLERGRSWVFACSLDWPGWCRRGKGDEAARQALLAYRPRYATVVGGEFEPGPLEVVGSVEGGMSTDFGAPTKLAEWDKEPLAGDELGRFVAVLEDCWAAFDGVVSRVPKELRKGPRGGGRDRDQIVDHVREAERSYARAAGVSLPPRTPWNIQRSELAAQLRAGTTSGSWPARYAVRRCAWHVLDHAWEMEDRAI